MGWVHCSVVPAHCPRFVTDCDDRRILEAVDVALARRRKALKSLQKEIKKSGSSKV